MSLRHIKSEGYSYEEYLERAPRILRELDATLEKLDLNLRKEHHITNTEVRKIVEIASRESNTLEPHDEEYFIKHAKNGVLKLYDDEDILKGFIFAHDGIVEDVEFYERGSLWINENLRNKGYRIGKGIMYKMTENLEGKGIISVTANEHVQNINRKLMPYEISSPQGLLKKIVLHGGPIDETYKVYVNDILMNTIENKEKL